MDSEGVARNPVSVKLCRSGECMCGTMQNEGDRFEAAYWFPEWHQWLQAIEKQVIEKHGMTWNDAKSLKNAGGGKQMATRADTVGEFQPMCTGCKVAYNLVNELPFVHLQ